VTSIFAVHLAELDRSWSRARNKRTKVKS